MLRIAQEEGVVTHLSNLYDTFFPGGRDHRIERPSITQVPYFEGGPPFLLASLLSLPCCAVLIEHLAVLQMAFRMSSLGKWLHHDTDLCTDHCMAEPPYRACV